MWSTPSGSATTTNSDMAGRWRGEESHSYDCCRYCLASCREVEDGHSTRQL